MFNIILYMHILKYHLINRHNVAKLFSRMENIYMNIYFILLLQFKIKLWFFLFILIIVDVYLKHFVCITTAPEKTQVCLYRLIHYVQDCDAE